MATGITEKSCGDFLATPRHGRGVNGRVGVEGRSRGPHQAMGLYAHLGWHTKSRVPTVWAKDVTVIVDSFRAAGARTKVRVHAIAVLSEHVHLMVSYPPSARLSDFVRDAKSESSRRINRTRGSKRWLLDWCRGFYANAVCHAHLNDLRLYIASQAARHPDRLPICGDPS